MDKEHILPQRMGVTVRWIGPGPEERFDSGTLEELYLNLCKEGFEYRRFERIGVDAGAVMHGSDGSDCRIETQRIVIDQVMGSYGGFDVFRRRLMTLLGLITEHFRAGPLFGAMISLSALWPTQNDTDLREVFTPHLLQVHKEQIDLLDAEVDNTSFTIYCTTKKGAEDYMHCTLSLEPDMTDPHRLKITVDAHSHEVLDDSKELEAVLQHVFDFLMERAGPFVESLTLEEK